MSLLLSLSSPPNYSQRYAYQNDRSNIHTQKNTQPTLTRFHMRMHCGWGHHPQTASQPPTHRRPPTLYHHRHHPDQTTTTHTQPVQPPAPVGFRHYSQTGGERETARERERTKSSPGISRRMLADLDWVAGSFIISTTAELDLASSRAPIHPVLCRCARVCRVCVYRCVCACACACARPHGICRAIALLLCRAFSELFCWLNVRRRRTNAGVTRIFHQHKYTHTHNTRQPASSLPIHRPPPTHTHTHTSCTERRLAFCAAAVAVADPPSSAGASSSFATVFPPVCACVCKRMCDSGWTFVWVCVCV